MYFWTEVRGYEIQDQKVPVRYIGIYRPISNTG
jgi:hypothetical protein